MQFLIGNLAVYQNHTCVFYRAQIEPNETHGTPVNTIEKYHQTQHHWPSARTASSFSLNFSAIPRSFFFLGNVLEGVNGDM